MEAPNGISYQHRRKRARIASPDLLHKQKSEFRSQRQPNDFGGRKGIRQEISERKELETFAKEQTRLNQIQEAQQMRDWVSKEDEFVLKQSKKKARIRVREGRAKIIDWLAVTLSAIDKSVASIEDDIDEPNVDIIDPTGVFHGMDQSQLHELGKDIGVYLTLESNAVNRKYWSVRFTQIYHGRYLLTLFRHWM